MSGACGRRWGWRRRQTCPRIRTGPPPPCARPPTRSPFASHADPTSAMSPDERPADPIPTPPLIQKFGAVDGGSTYCAAADSFARRMSSAVRAIEAGAHRQRSRMLNTADQGGNAPPSIDARAALLSRVRARLDDAAKVGDLTRRGCASGDNTSDGGDVLEDEDNPIRTFLSMCPDQ
jgi:hypothetical protein